MKLRDYQIRAAEHLYANDHCALFADPGLGKTAITLALLHRLKRDNPKHRTLLIAPLRVCRYVWPDEMDAWRGTLSVHHLHGADKTEAHSGADIELINPEGLKWLTSRRSASDWDTLIVDESSQFRNPRAVRLKLLKPWLSAFKRVHILTGTPQPRSLEDLWAQMYLLDQGRALGKCITHYRQRWFIQRPYCYDWIAQPGAEREVWAAIAHLCLRLDPKLIDLPPLISTPIVVDLPESARRTYRYLDKKLCAEINGATHLSTTAATKYGECCQVAGGAMYIDGEPVELHSAKTEALQELVAELGGKPLLIGYHYSHEGTRISAALGCPVIDGHTSDMETTALLAAWNAGELVALAAQYRTLSHGLNLQKGGCADVAWFAPPDDLDAFDQFNRRVYRSGVTGESVRLHLLIARGTVDEVNLARLRDRYRSQKSFLDYLLEYSRGRERKAA